MSKLQKIEQVAKLLQEIAAEGFVEGESLMIGDPSGDGKFQVRVTFATSLRKLDEKFDNLVRAASTVVCNYEGDNGKIRDEQDIENLRIAAGLPTEDERMQQFMKERFGPQDDNSEESA